MTEPTPTPDAVTADGTPPADEPKPITAEDFASVQKALEKERQIRKDREKELGEFRAQTKAQMTESERAVAEAEERGRMAAVTAYGERLAKTEFIAEAARRNGGYDAAAILEDLNLARYIGEDGEPDSKAIAKAVERLIPAAQAGAPTPPSFDGGTRTATPSSASMSDLIRQAAGRA